MISISLLPRRNSWEVFFLRAARSNCNCLLVYLHFVNCHHVLLSTQRFSLGFVPSNHRQLRKRSRARVTIEGQRVLLQISLQIKMLNFLLNSQNHIMNHIFPGKIWETRPQSSKNAQKLTKISKIHDVDKITLLFGFL